MLSTENITNIALQKRYTKQFFQLQTLLDIDEGTGQSPMSGLKYKEQEALRKCIDAAITAMCKDAAQSPDDVDAFPHFVELNLSSEHESVVTDFNNFMKGEASMSSLRHKVQARYSQ